MGDVQRGQLRRRRLLGSEAVYRVISVDSGHAVVEVVDAPGLELGARIRLTLEQVEQMELEPEA